MHNQSPEVKPSSYNIKSMSRAAFWSRRKRTRMFTIITVVSMLSAIPLTPARADIIGVHIGGCTYGFLISADFFPLHWPFWYLNPLRIESAFGGGGHGYYAKGGISTGLNLPFGRMFSIDPHLPGGSSLDQRIGCGVSGGIMHQEEGATYHGSWDQWQYVS
jgi:hypothetical protein